jgi:hypothetical protein
MDRRLTLRKSIIAGAALTASLALAGTAQADTVTTDFDGFDDGSVHNQGGWLAANTNVDQDVVPVAVGKALRISNAFTSGSFSDMPHSKPVAKRAGENEATNRLVNEFTIQAPETFVEGLGITFSPDEGQGSRMSRVRFEDRADGVHVLFADATFVDQDIATLDRTVPHKVEIETTFVQGHDNDVVRVIIDGDQKMRGGSWENYYRESEERNPSASDRLLIRTAGVAAPLTVDNGFLVDDVTTKSSYVRSPAPLNPPAPGPAGQDGTNGTNGVNGADGVNGTDGANGTAGNDGVNGTNGVNGANGANGTDGVTNVIRDNGTITGATLRTLHVRKIAGMKFISARASLRGKSVKSIHGRTIKVDLRGKAAGKYRVVIAAKYKADGKVYKVRSVRGLSIVRK